MYCTPTLMHWLFSAVTDTAAQVSDIRHDCTHLTSVKHSWSITQPAAVTLHQRLNQNTLQNIKCVRDQSITAALECNKSVSSGRNPLNISKPPEIYSDRPKPALDSLSLSWSLAFLNFLRLSPLNPTGACRHTERLKTVKSTITSASDLIRACEWFLNHVCCRTDHNITETDPSNSIATMHSKHHSQFLHPVQLNICWRWQRSH